MSAPDVTASARTPVLVKAAEHAPLGVLGQRISLLAGPETTGGLELFHLSGAAGAGPIPHAHAWDESFYVLDGQVELQVLGREPVTMSAGDFAYLPGGTFHGFRVKSAQARMFSTSSAAGAHAFFRDLAQEVGDQLNIPKIVEISGRHGILLPPRPPSA